MNEGRELDSEGLTRKQRHFVNEYVIDRKAVEACIRAGYSEKSAHSAAYRLLGHERVKAALEERLDQQQVASDTTVDKIVREYARVAFSSIDGYFMDVEGVKLLKPMSEWPPAAAAAVQSFTVDNDGRMTGLKLWPKTEALRSLATFRAMFVDRVAVTVQVEAIDRNIIDVSPAAGNEPAPADQKALTNQQVTGEST